MNETHNTSPNTLCEYDEHEIRHIKLGNQTITQVLKLPQQMIDYMWQCIDIAKKNPICHNNYLAGRISHSYKLKDSHNLVVRNLLDLFYNSDNNPEMFEFINNEINRTYKKMGVIKKGMTLAPHLDVMWVNFQKKGEFQPLHTHDSTFSFVIWMDIPYDCKDENKLHFARSNSPGSTCGNFSFAFPCEVSRSIVEHFIELSPKMNGYCCFFPSDLSHQVYPFYTSDKDRISISGNISYYPMKLNSL